MLLSLSLLVAGIVVLVIAADLFIDAIVDLANSYNISPMIVSLTVVSIGTSLPEACASVAASLEGYPEIALGNVMGSNIANVGLIIGVPALYFTIVCTREVLRREGMFMLFCTLLVYTLALFEVEFTRAIGVLFLGLFAFFVWFVVRRLAEKETEQEWSEFMEDEPGLSPLRLGIKIVVTLCFVLASSHILVSSAVSLASALGVSQNIIAISMIAIGTSLPELSVSIAAARRGEGSVLIGNVLGSNVSNILLVLGLTALVHPFSISKPTTNIDLPFVLLFAILMVLFLFRNKGINRMRGVLFLLLYGLFIWRCVKVPV